MSAKLKEAELFAKDRHRNQKYGDKPYYTHLKDVVDRLKALGITDDKVLCAAWLHDTIEDTDTTFDEIYQRFGRDTAVMVKSLSKDTSLPKKEKETQCIEQLKCASWNAQLIKLCDISSNLKELKNSNWSKSRKTKYVKKKSHNLHALKSGLLQNKSNVPGIHDMVNGLNNILIEYGIKPINF